MDESLHEMKQAIGRRLKAARLAQGMSQVYVADKMGAAGNSTISQWETGVNELGLHDMARLCQLYDLTYEWLLEGCGDRMKHGLLTKIEAILGSFPSGTQ